MIIIIECIDNHHPLLTLYSSIVVLLSILSVLKLDHWVPKVTKLSQLQFSQIYLIFWLASIDIIGVISIIMIIFGVQSVLPIVMGSFYISYVYIYSPICRSYPYFLNTFTIGCWIVSTIIVYFGSEFAIYLPWSLYWDFQVAKVEMKYIGSTTLPTFAILVEENVIEDSIKIRLSATKEYISSSNEAEV
jgi:hypothetical protein